MEESRQEPDLIYADAGRVALCPSCGRPLPTDAPRQLCPGCLLRDCLEEGSADDLAAEPPDPGAPVGTVLQIEGFEILDELGRGGTGVVYRARERALDRWVALKVLTASPVLSPGELKRFETEARIVCALDHPHILPVYSVGNSKGQQYLVMRLVEGGSLGERMQEFRVPPARPDADRAKLSARVASIARVVRAVASAIQHAHDHGVIHRDLKPANILLDTAGRPFVTDFGLAKVSAADPSLTRTRAVMGTPAYMSPEQARGQAKQLTPAADIFSLGTILYEMLTGRPPFWADDAIVLLQRIATGVPVAPRVINPLVPRDLETICLKCLEKEPARRYPSAGELAADLQRYAEGMPILARPPNTVERVILWSRRRPALAALAVVSLASLIVIVGLWSRAEAFARAARISAESNRTLLVRNWVMEAWNKADSGDVPGAMPWFLAAWASDLKSGAGPERLEVHSRRFAGLLEHRPLVTQMWPLHGAGNALAVSSDARWVAAGSADGQARVWDTGAPHKEPVALTVQGFIVEAGFRPGSADLLLATHRTNSLGLVVAWDLEHGTRKFEVSLDSRLRGLAFSPDGKFVALGSSSGMVTVLDAQSGELLFQNKTHRDGARSLEFIPNTDDLATGGWDGQIVITDWRRNTTVGSMDVAGEYVRDLQVSKDGARVVFGTDGGEAIVWQPFTGGRTVRHRHEARVGAVALTHDGKRVASGDASGLVELWDAETGVSLDSWLDLGQSVRSLEFSPDDRWLLTMDVGGQVRVLDIPGSKASPVAARLGSANNKARWLSNGAVVTASRDAFVRVWQMDRAKDEGGPAPFHDALAISRDGQRVAAANAKLRLALWRVQPDGHLVEAGPPVPFDGERIEFSPNGLWLAAFGGNRQLSIFDSSTAALAVSSAELPSVAQCGCWSPDSETFLLGSAAGRVSRVRWRTGSVTELALASRSPVLKILSSPDGQRFATATGSTETDLTVPGIVRLWDASTGQPASPELVHSNSITSWEFSPDGHFLAVGDLAHTVRVWDLARAGAKASTLPHGDAITSLAFAEDGQSLITGSVGHMLRVWDWRTGQLRSAFSPFPESVRIEMDARGRLMLLHGRRHYARLWDVDSLEPVSRAWNTGEPQERVALSANGLLTASIGENQQLLCFASPQAIIGFERAAALTLALSGALVDAQGHLIPAAAADIQAAWDRLQAGSKPQ